MRPTLYLIDGHYQIYRSFYGLPGGLTSPTGEPTGATHVFCSMLFSLIRQRRPNHLAMIMDVSDETVFRRDLDPDYKAHRDPPPEALEVQLHRIVSIVEGLGIPIHRVPGFEADDVMATIAERVRHQNVHVYLVSRDKDLEQLITDRVTLYDPVKDADVDAKALLATKGYAPEQAVEIQTLVGDATDNVPGVNGVGLKTAAKLIGQYGSADAVLAHADELTPKLRDSIKSFASQVRITRQLVTLRRDVPMEFDLSACAVSRISTHPVRRIFSELGFNRLQETLELIEVECAAKSGDAPARSTPTSGPTNPGFLFADDPAEEPRSRSAATASRPPTSSPEVRGSSRDSLAAEVGSARPAHATANYTLVDSPDALDELVRRLVDQPLFAFDTETTGINPVASQLVGLSVSWRAGEAYYLPVRAAVGDVLPMAQFIERLKPVLENPRIGKVGHHAKYDMVVLRQVGIRTQGLAFDTLLASFVLDPLRRSHSLDSLAAGLLGHDMIPITDLIGKGKNQLTMDLVDTRRVCEYAAEDADYTWRLMELMKPQLAGTDLEPLFRDTEMPLVDVLAEMEHHGISLDVDLLRSLGGSIGDRLVELTGELHQRVGHPFNLDSPKQLSAVLFDELGFHSVKKTKTGRSTDAETLEALAAQTDHPVPRLLLEYRELSKLKGTYVDTLPKMVCRRTGRVHASFHQTGAITGRLSSSDPNLQNIPIRTETGRRIREAIIAESPDDVILSADYSQIELRLLAHFCEDTALVEAFRQGMDIHQSVAAEVFGVPVEAVTTQQRGVAKAVNFGIIYGQTAMGLSRTLSIRVGEAKSFIDAYFKRYPGIRSFIDRCVEEARTRGHAQTILGRRRPIPELHSRNHALRSFGERIAVNTVVQGSAADLIKRAMIDIHRAIRAGQLSARMVIQVHDELVFETPRSQVEASAKLIRQSMEGAFSLRVPIAADVGWGRNWAESKK